MEIKLELGEDLVIKTARGTIGIGWVYETENIMVNVIYNPTDSSVQKMTEDTIFDSPTSKMASSIIIRKKQGNI